MLLKLSDPKIISDKPTVWENHSYCHNEVRRVHPEGLWVTAPNKGKNRSIFCKICIPPGGFRGASQWSGGSYELVCVSEVWPGEAGFNWELGVVMIQWQFSNWLSPEIGRNSGMLIRKQQTFKMRQEVGRVSGYIVSSEPLSPVNFATTIVCVYPPSMINNKAAFLRF